MGFFDKLKNGLTKTRESIAKQVNQNNRRNRCLRASSRNRDVHAW